MLSLETNINNNCAVSNGEELQVDIVVLILSLEGVTVNS